MLAFFKAAFSAVPAVATSWPALVGYVIVVTAFTVISLKVKRNSNLLAKLEKVPEDQRAKALQMEMGAAFLAEGFKPRDWLLQQRQRYYFTAFLVACCLLSRLPLWSSISP
jgi:hypothetical protein